MRDARASQGASGTLLREGDTCWRVVRANRLAVLIDGEAYFGAVADAIESARHSVWLIGWDFHSRVRLRRDAEPGRIDELKALLDARVRARRALQVRVLGWDFAMLYTLEREFLPLLQFGARTHRRIHFAMDGAHPATASQHQKLVVVDDALAFCGGFDLTSHRWDTREHACDDPRRATPSGERYQPFHDVQVAVDGGAAAAIADLARERWQRATGRRVAPTTAAGDPWPRLLEPTARDVDVGIARTVASYLGEPEVREVERLYRASIAAARHWIYIENQYLTSAAIADALAERLRESDGPEVVIVGPRENSGWLEQNTMGALRDRVARQLVDADCGDRLRILYPHLDCPGDCMLNVHAKLMIVDDDLARVGSSNLSNRSLGLDTECDLAFEAGGRADLRAAIAALRADLLAEHLGVSPDLVAREVGRCGSLVRAIDALAGDGRSLRALALQDRDWAAEALDAVGAVDPEHPAPLEELLTRFDEDAAGEPNRRRGWVRLGALVGAIAAFALLWNATPLSEWISPERLSPLLSTLRDAWWGPPVAWAAFALASLCFVPVTALTAATGIALGPVLGTIVAWTGSVAAAAIAHGAGRALLRETVRQLAGERLQTLNRRLARRGILSSALVRIVPVAPFMVVNLVAGASRVRLRDFAFGSALGMLPGCIALVLGANGLAAWVRGDAGPGWLWAALIAFAVLGAIATAARLLARPSTRRRGE